MKKFYKILALFIALLCIVDIEVGNIMLEVAVHPKSTRRFDVKDCYEAVYKQYPEMREWHDTLVAKGNLRDTMLLDMDEVYHHALIFCHDSLAQGSSVVLHGYDDNAPRMLRYAYLHYELLNRNVIVPDHFYHGNSGGDHVRFGWLDRLDVTNLWLPMTHELWPDEKMIVHGLSMGGALTMFVSGEEIPDSLNLTGYIEDCGFSSIWEELKFQLKSDYGLPAWPILHTANWLCKLKYGWTFKEGDAHKQLAKCNKPMLFIHGDTDTYVPTFMLQQNYDAKTQGYKELWLVPGADHAESIHNEWEEYAAHCKAYIDKIENM